MARAGALTQDDLNRIKIWDRQLFKINHMITKLNSLNDLLGFASLCINLLTKIYNAKEPRDKRYQDEVYKVQKAMIKGFRFYISENFANELKEASNKRRHYKKMTKQWVELNNIIDVEGHNEKKYKVYNPQFIPQEIVFDVNLIGDKLQLK